MSEQNVKRRSVLLVSAGATVTTLSGCLSRRSDRPENGESLSTIEYDVIQFGTESSSPWWGSSREIGYLESVESSDDVEDFRDYEWLEDIESDRLEEIRAFVDDVNFEDELLVYVASGGPNMGYIHVKVDSLEVDGDAIIGTAQAYEPELADEDEHVYASALVHVIPDDGWPERVVFTITNGWDQSEDFEITP